jgi:hypothetical protein
MPKKLRMKRKKLQGALHCVRAREIGKADLEE